jgi:predicted short-subunit dehydrogenase-like oxidoreductase (DUF2520 family)
LGTVLALALHSAGYSVVGCASRTLESAQRLADRIPGCAALPSSHLARRAEVIFMGVPDDAISEVDAELPWTDRHLAVHCSGARPASVLLKAAQCGARVAGFHPLQTFADPDTGLRNLPGSTVGIEADDDTWMFLCEIADSLGMNAIRIGAEDRALYHAASVLVSNGTVGLMAAAAHLWESLGVQRSDAMRALLPLLEGTVRNLDTLGIPNALTGPVVRGDLGTIQRHIKALAETPRELSVYLAVSDWLVELALERGTITAEQGTQLRQVITGRSERAQEVDKRDG